MRVLRLISLSISLVSIVQSWSGSILLTHLVLQIPGSVKMLALGHFYICFLIAESLHEPLYSTGPITQLSSLSPDTGEINLPTYPVSSCNSRKAHFSIPSPASIKPAGTSMQTLPTAGLNCFSSRMLGPSAHRNKLVIQPNTISGKNSTNSRGGSFTHRRLAGVQIWRQKKLMG